MKLYNVVFAGVIHGVAADNEEEAVTKSIAGLAEKGLIVEREDLLEVRDHGEYVEPEPAKEEEPANEMPGPDADAGDA